MIKAWLLSTRLLLPHSCLYKERMRGRNTACIMLINKKFKRRPYETNLSLVTIIISFGRNNTLELEKRGKGGKKKQKHTVEGSEKQIH